MNLLSNLLYKRNVNRAEKISNFHKGYIKPGQKILDIGLGNGLIASQIKKEYNIKIKGIDVIDYNESDIELKLFDGENIPFKDNEFDIALIIVVLHHCNKPIKVLKEAKRVAKRIIILEDTYTSKLLLPFCKAYDFIMNVRHGIDIPFNFKKHEEWLEIFRKLKLRLLATKIYTGSAWYSPLKTRLYVIER